MIFFQSGDKSNITYIFSSCTKSIMQMLYIAKEKNGLTLLEVYVVPMRKLVNLEVVIWSPFLYKKCQLSTVDLSLLGRQ